MRKTLLWGIAFVLSLNGCSSLFGRDGYFRDRGDDYLKASEIPPMTVPQGLDSATISELFLIPPISNEFIDLDQEYEVPRSSFNSLQEKSQVKIQKLESRRWILVNNNPASIWPRLKAFLGENQLPLALEDAAAGQLETVWLTLKDQADAKDRYRFSVEQGLHINTTEVHVLQVTVPLNTPINGNMNWPLQSSNPEREKWMLDKLAAYLAQEKTEPVSLLAQSIGRSQKVSFVQPYQGESFILMGLDSERVMASVGGALNRLPFKVEDVDYDKGFINASYDPEYEDGDDQEELEEPGFFSRLFGWDKHQENQKTQRLLHYQVQIQAFAPGEMRVFIRDKDGNVLSMLERDRLLQKIRQRLL